MEYWKTELRNEEAGSIEPQNLEFSEENDIMEY